MTNNGQPNPELRAAFLRFWDTYPQRAGGNPKKAAALRWKAAVDKGVAPETLERQAAAYARYCDAQGWLGTERVKQARFWLSPTYEGWAQDWTVKRTTATPQFRQPVPVAVVLDEVTGRYKPVTR